MDSPPGQEIRRTIGFLLLVRPPAELSVKLNVDEAASPTYYSSSKSSSAEFSRLANHDTTTKVRVDSIKMFNVSTITAELQKARTRFPLLPPLVEIPCPGTVDGVPLPPAAEYHSSSAIISAIVVSTATDIALGLTFTRDYIVDANGASACQWQTGDVSSFIAQPLPATTHSSHGRAAACGASTASMTSIITPQSFYFTKRRSPA